MLASVRLSTVRVSVVDRYHVQTKETLHLRADHLKQ